MRSLLNSLKQLNDNMIYLYDINPSSLVLFECENEGITDKSIGSIIKLDLKIPIPSYKKQILYFTPKFFMTFNEVVISDK